ncbi:MAG TPA: Sec-independent protein translocase protein TatB [Stellaceae bacterium]|nr:Sec-independent protein translocase protein TatB [Stellaceae bacterium]
MFDIGWSELALIAVVALVVIGPKDLPRALKTIGVYVRKARGMAREFQNTVDDMIREAELDDVKNQVQAISKFDVKSAVTKAIDPDGDVRAALEPPEMPSIHTPTGEIAPNAELPVAEFPGGDAPAALTAETAPATAQEAPADMPAKPARKKSTRKKTSAPEVGDGASPDAMSADPKPADKPAPIEPITHPPAP